MAMVASPAMAAGQIKAAPNPNGNVVTITPAPNDASKAKADVHFRNCSEARANGYSRMRLGEPGYARHLDRDNDGIACE
jgi:hypothetical protein